MKKAILIVTIPVALTALVFSTLLWFFLHAG